MTPEQHRLLERLARVTDGTPDVLVNNAEGEAVRAALAELQRLREELAETQRARKQALDMLNEEIPARAAAQAAQRQAEARLEGTLDANADLLREKGTLWAERNSLRAQKDGAYAERNQCVALIARMALKLGWRVSVGRHPDLDTDWEDDWRTLLFVDLPTGQATWHFQDRERPLLDGLPVAQQQWDGHDTPEKYRRVNAALAESPGETRAKEAERERKYLANMAAMADGTALPFEQEEPAPRSPAPPKETETQVSAEEFEALLEYSSSLPTLTTIGKRWKRRVVGWKLGEYVEHPEPGKVGIKWTDLVVDAAPRSPVNEEGGRPASTSDPRATPRP